MTEELVVQVTELGEQGDGIALVGETRVFVAGALPGEKLRVRSSGTRADIIEILEPSADRHPPRCPHDAVCGGCALQPLGSEGEASFKQDLLAKALAREGVIAENLHPLYTVPERTRRRASFALWKERGAVHFGFQGKRTHDLVAIKDCAVVMPQIIEAMPQIAKALSPIVSNRNILKIDVTAFERGLDLNLTGSRLDPVDLPFEAMDSFAVTVALPQILRLSLDGVPYLEPEAPAITFGGVSVLPPPGAFLQATLESEAEMQRLVTEALTSRETKGPVADLFCGCGTFTLPIGEHMEVTGFDAEAPQVEALETAVQRAAQNRVHGQRRDLFRRPLVEDELKKFNAVVLDPPRAGAKEQIERIAASSIPLVVYVSCDRKTFARDAKVLVESGFKLKELTPIDQFRYAAHLECVGVFERGKRP